jgi:chromosome segregation protein
MRLKDLELQGYKTFASRTQFVFDSGITAIVGPNGSGKSNVADAIRWVLGEQSYRTLRGKRTEDMIFSGSSQRARLGMASASLTLDNDDGWLPVDFSEVTITRRAYRSGDNEYLLNGSRVRLRDITELLSKSGLAHRTYTVIGQGLVDAVLSLRPEDRRTLFEEAAGITLYQSKRADALSRLEETRSNLVRVNDIINEIAPRLRRLERESEQANRHDLLSQQLEGLLRTWYGFRWWQEQQNLHRTRDALSRREARVERSRQDLDNLDERMADLRVRQAQLRERLGAWHLESGELHRQMEEVQRDLAVWRERARLLTRQRDEIQAELAELAVQVQATVERIDAANEEVAGSQQALREQESLVAQAQADLDAHEARRASLAQHVADAQRQALDLATQAADRRNRLAQLEERRAGLAEERAAHQAAIVDLEAGAGAVRSQIQVVGVELARAQSEQETLQAQAAQLEAELVRIQARQSELRSALAEEQRILERFQARYDLLTRLREEGEGLHAGVRAVLQAKSTKHLQASDSQASNPLGGIVGTVVQLLHVPAEYEIAIEVALGGHLQDIVVETWSDAETAISYLQEGRRGRATFLPLDTVRPVRRLEVPVEGGVVGVAADLVRAEDRLAPVVEMLLGRTIVTRDLKAARQTFARLKGGFQIVTLAGEVLRSSGSVTGGQGRNESQGQVLAREREWRELPARLAAAQKSNQQLQGKLDDALAAEEQLHKQSAAYSAQLQEWGKTSAGIQSRQRDLERDVDEIVRQIKWRQDLIAQLDREATELDMSQSSLRDAMIRLTAEEQEAENRVISRQAELDQLRGEVLYQCLSDARTAAAVARGRWEHRQETLATLQERLAQLQAQIESKRQRTAGLDQERKSLSKQIGSRASREVVILGWLASLNQKIEPAEAEVTRLETEREGFEREENSFRARLRAVESGYSQALLAHNRQEDRLERLRRQIMDDFGLVEMEPTEGLAEQPPLPLAGMVSSLPVVEDLPEGLEDEIHEIKAQLRRMGAVNPNAPDEYAEVLDRYTFLTAQAADLEEAASSLREVIAELDEVMRREFLETFQAVEVRFKENFAQLFGGGTARLLLTEPDNISLAGVEIVARPPGKRQQTLALLSGGERSLTAVALIFALLEVRPPPFCILDEVDAMLDEANVKRFRSALEELSQHTQFIVITHNRGTIHAADIIYGVSMGEDSVSQVVSLRLEGERIAAPDGSAVDIAKDG